MPNKGAAAIQRQAERLTRLNVEYVKVGDVVPNTWNPNKQSDHDFELLIRSIMEDGFTQPIVVKRVEKADKTDPDLGQYAQGQVVITDGEHRWTAAIVVEALRQEGITDTARLDPDHLIELRTRRVDLMGQMPDLEIPVVFSPMTPSQMRIATLRHNRARGSEDIELSADLLRDLQQLGALEWAQDSLMLDDVEVQQLLDDVPAAEILAGDEYSEAWQPVPATEETPPPDGANVTVGMTAAAVERMRQQEQAVHQAHNDEERAAARRDNDVYRISLVFTGDEAKAVRAVLGDRPADRMLELCRSALPSATQNGHAPA